MSAHSSPPWFEARALERPDDARIAYHRTPGAADKTGLVWLGGFRSDMEGSKALALHEWARAADRPFVRFDYFGHGASTGRFEDGSIGRWADDALAVLDALTDGPQILVGSSMGGWIALLAALARPERVAGLVLIAPAPDFTERLMWASFPDDVRATILEHGVYHLPSDAGEEPTPITRLLIEDGRAHLLYDRPSIAVRAPVRILQGAEDRDVPWRHALGLVLRLESPDVEFLRIDGGDHRLSTEADVARMIRVVERLAAQLEGGSRSAASTAASPSA